MTFVTLHPQHPHCYRPTQTMCPHGQNTNKTNTSIARFFDCKNSKEDKINLHIHGHKVKTGTHQGQTGSLNER